MSDPKHVEERQVRRGDLNMRLLINRSHRHLRFMDYRVGNYEQKCAILEQVVREEGLLKIFTLVEKSDSSNWRAMGFYREGVYPSFFRTADAYMMSKRFDAAGAPVQDQSPAKAQSEEQPSSLKKLALPQKVQLELIEDERSKLEVMDRFNGHLRALPFGRASTPDVIVFGKTKKNKGWACAEIEDSFGHAVVGFAPPPCGEPDLGLATCLGAELLEALDKREVDNLFGLSPSNDKWSYELFLKLDFHVTGKLVDHLQTAAGTDSALLWHRRLGAGRAR